MSFSLIRPCPACGANNRTPADRLADTGRCGSCQTALGPASEPIDVDPAAFDHIVATSQVPVLVDFWAAWCGPCRMAAPQVHDLAREMAGRALVLKVDTERYPQLGARFRVQAIPNFLILKDGQPIRQQAGLAPPAEMRRWIAEAEGTSAAATA